MLPSSPMFEPIQYESLDFRTRCQISLVADLSVDTCGAGLLEDGEQLALQ